MPVQAVTQNQIQAITNSFNELRSDLAEKSPSFLLWLDGFLSVATAANETKDNDKLIDFLEASQPTLPLLSGLVAEFRLLSQTIKLMDSATPNQATKAETKAVTPSAISLSKPKQTASTSGKQKQESVIGGSKLPHPFPKEGWSSVELATQLGISKSQLHRIKQKPGALEQLGWRYEEPTKNRLAYYPIPSSKRRETKSGL